MPAGRVYLVAKGKSRKRRIRKRKVRRMNRRRNVVPRTITSTGIGFPKKMLMTHKYSQHVLQQSTGGLVTFDFSANGMYDPNISGAGHQPMYFDQMTTLYDHYHVIGSSFKVYFPPDTDVQYVCGVYLNDNTSLVPTSWDGLVEQTQCKRYFVYPTAVKPTCVTQKWSAKKIFGGSILGNAELQGDAAGNPPEQTYYTFFFQPTDKFSSTSSLPIIVEVRYIAIWSELKDVAQS